MILIEVLLLLLLFLLAAVEAGNLDLEPGRMYNVNLGLWVNPSTASMKATPEAPVAPRTRICSFSIFTCRQEKMRTLDECLLVKGDVVFWN